MPFVKTVGWIRTRKSSKRKRNKADLSDNRARIGGGNFELVLPQKWYKLF